MEELYFDEIKSRINSAYKNLFLLAVKKKINLGPIVDTVAEEIEKYKESIDGFLPEGIDGLLFVTGVAQMLGYSLFDVLYMSQKDRERILLQVFEEITVSNLIDFSEFHFIYAYYLDENNDDFYEFVFEVGNDYTNYDIELTLFTDWDYGFSSDLIYDRVIAWEGSEGEIRDFIDETIYEAMKSLKDNKEEKIDYKDFFIYSSERACGHDLIKVIATVPIYSKGKVTTIQIDADYCAECGVYYISYNDYLYRILPQGRLLCQVLSIEEYLDYKRQMKNYGELKPQSILNMIGYNVNAKDNLSENERRTILRYAIESGVITKKLTIFYLQTFIKKGNAKKGLEMAVKKWKSDLQWVYDFDKKGDIVYGVRKIITDSSEIYKSNSHRGD